MSKIFFDSIPVLKIDEAQEQQFEEAVRDIQRSYAKEKAQKIDMLLFDAYHLDENDISEIGYIEIK